MRISASDRRLDRPAAGRRSITSVSASVLVLTLVCWLLTSCAADHPSGRAESPLGTPSDRASVATTPAPSPTDAESTPRRARTAPDPETRDPADLAAHLEAAVTTIHDQQASATELRRAGEFQQLAIRNLANAPADFRRAVLRRLQPRAETLTRSQLKAAAALATISGPAERMPKWRVVRPAPPERLLRYYRAAQRRTGVHWSYLAAIHLVETRMGRIRGTSTAGAQGPMQFIPQTWQAYGNGGDIHDNRDAIMAAARLLRANGAPRDMSEALYRYNPADGYVTAVAEYARSLRRSPDSYRGYWHWRVLYGHRKGTFLLPVGYPHEPAVRLQPVD